MYIIQELQTNTEGLTVVVPAVRKTSIEEADNEFYTKAAYSAISAVSRHAVSMFTNEGFPIKNKFYDHI